MVLSLNFDMVPISKNHLRAVFDVTRAKEYLFFAARIRYCDFPKVTTTFCNQSCFSGEMCDKDEK